MFHSVLQQLHIMMRFNKQTFYSVNYCCERNEGRNRLRPRDPSNLMHSDTEWKRGREDCIETSSPTVSLSDCSVTQVRFCTRISQSSLQSEMSKKCCVSEEGPALAILFSVIICTQPLGSMTFIETQQ